MFTDKNEASWHEEGQCESLCSINQNDTSHSWKGGRLNAVSIFFLCLVYEMLIINAPTSSRNPVVNLYIT